MRKTQSKRLVVVVLATLAAAAMALAGLLGASGAAASPRSDAEEDKKQAEQKLDSLGGELDQIDDELTSLFDALQQTTAEVAELQTELAAAEQHLADAERKHAQLVDQLADAEALRDEIALEIEESQAQEAELSVAVGNLAREMYRGESVSPLQIVTNMTDLGEVSGEAAAAGALSRAQSRAINEVRTGLVVSENQAQRQEAVTERITDLEAQAKEAAEEAQVARDEVESGLAAVQAKQIEQQAAQAAWEDRKVDVEIEIEGASADLADAIAEIARIDKAEQEAREAAARAEAERKAAAEEAARKAAEAAAAQSKPATGNSGGSTAPKPSTSTPSTPKPSTSTPSGGGGSGMFGNPFSFRARITSYFGYRVHPVTGVYKLHDGTDFGAACGTTQYATREGTVARSGWDTWLGNYVTINHGVIGGRSYITTHGHLSQRYVSAGQRVSRGTPIGLTGTTGSSTGCHLHLMLYVDGTPVSILPYM